MSITTLTITDNPDGSVSLEMSSNHVAGENFSNGVKLASQMLKKADEIMVEQQFKQEVVE